MRMWGRSLAVALPLALGLALGSCGDDDDTTGVEQETILGTYVLTTVNGNPLPFTDEPGAAEREEITAMTIVLRPNNVVTGTLSFRDFSGGQVVDQGTVPFAGTFTVSGSTVTLTIADDDPVTGTVNANALTVTIEGDVFRFTKQ